MLIVLLVLVNVTPIFADQDIYALLQGAWNSPSQGEMDIVLNIDAKGKFDLLIIPAFEYTNITLAEQSNIIKQYISDKGYFKQIELLPSIDEGVLVQMETLLNGELSTNIINIKKENVYIYDTNSKTQELFMVKPSF